MSAGAGMAINNALGVGQGPNGLRGKVGQPCAGTLIEWAYKVHLTRNGNIGWLALWGFSLVCVPPGNGHNIVFGIRVSGDLGNVLAYNFEVCRNGNSID